MFNEKVAGPESVDLPDRALQLRYVALEDDKAPTVDAEDLEPVIPEALAFSVLARFALPLLDERACVTSDVAEVLAAFLSGARGGKSCRYCLELLLGSGPGSKLEIARRRLLFIRFAPHPLGEHPWCFVGT